MDIQEIFFSQKNFYLLHSLIKNAIQEKYNYDITDEFNKLLLDIMEAVYQKASEEFPQNILLLRLSSKSDQAVFELTQAMGGGKTHSMISLGLLAQDPDLRANVFGEDNPAPKLGKCKVVGFNGRSTDAALNRRCRCSNIPRGTH